MDYRSALFHTKEIFDTAATEQLFLTAVRENCRFQYEHCEPYRRILDSQNFHWDSLQSSEDLSRLPFLPTLLFKKHALFSLPRRKIALIATSTGTKGQFSQIGFDFGGLWCGLQMSLRVAAWRKLLSPTPCHYLVMGYRPHHSNRTAVTKTAFGATMFAPALSRTYALTYRNGAYSVDLDGILRAVERHSRSRFPVRFMGFPSYAYFLLRLMEERGIRVQLPKGSLLMMGGGWKQFSAEQVDKTILYDLARRQLGLPEDHIIEFFGAVEHPVLYCDCKNHHFHVPAYSRVIIRDVHTLEPVKMGTVGLVNLITPMVRATPILSVMTDDLGVLHEGRECGCGIDSPYLELVGRIGLKDIKTCAAGAAEFLSQIADGR